MYISKVFKLELDFLSSLKTFPGKCNINQFLHHQNLSSLNDDTSSCKLVHFSKNYYLILLILNSWSYGEQEVKRPYSSLSAILYESIIFVNTPPPKKDFKK